MGFVYTHWVIHKNYDEYEIFPLLWMPWSRLFINAIDVYANWLVKTACTIIGDGFPNGHQNIR